MLKERYEPYVEAAVKEYAEVIREKQSNIMNVLKREMNSVPQSKEFWAQAVYFYSHKYAKGTPRLKDEHYRYQIWKYSTLCERLLEELQLDPTVFSFRLTSQHCVEMDIGIDTYYNTVMLIYSP